MKGFLKPDRKPRIYRGEDVTDFLPSFLFWKKPPARKAFAPSSPIPPGGGRGRQLHAAVALLPRLELPSPGAGTFLQETEHHCHTREA